MCRGWGTWAAGPASSLLFSLPGPWGQGMFTMLMGWAKAGKRRVVGGNELSHHVIVWEERMRPREVASGLLSVISPGKPGSTDNLQDGPWEPPAGSGESSTRDPRDVLRGPAQAGASEQGNHWGKWRVAGKGEFPFFTEAGG